jgi:RNA polymerase sigma factor (sigma-70 family)
MAAPREPLPASDTLAAAGRATAPVVSLDQPVGADGATTLGDLVADRAQPSLEDSAATTLVAAEVRQAVRASLNAREQAVVVLRYGLDGRGSKTLEEVSRHLGVTRERVRQLEMRALRKLRRALHALGEAECFLSAS